MWHDYLPSNYLFYSIGFDLFGCSVPVELLLTETIDIEWTTMEREKPDPLTVEELINQRFLIMKYTVRIPIFLEKFNSLSPTIKA